MHQLKHTDHIHLGGVGRIVGVNFWPEIRGAVEHLRRANRKQVTPISNEEARRVLLSVCPCWNLEHRLGVCPLGLSHRTEHHDEKKNNVTKYLKKSMIDRMVGNVSPVDLLITYVATGTSSDDTDPNEDQLFAEAYRDTPTYLASTSDTQAQVYWYFGPDKANTGSLLHEWGIMAGGATSAAGDGIMIARFLDTFDKNIGTAANGQYTANAAG